MARLAWKLFEGLGQVSLGHEHIANLIVAHGQIALPSCIIWIGFGEAVSNGEAGLEALQGFGQVSLGHEHVAHLVVGDRQIALPSGIVRIGFGETVPNCETGLEGFQGFRQVSLRHEHVANLDRRRPTDPAASRRCRDRLWRAGLEWRDCLGRTSRLRAGFLGPRARRPPCRRRPRDRAAIRRCWDRLWRAGLRMARLPWKDFKASGRFPCATSTSPTLS